MIQAALVEDENGVLHSADLSEPELRWVFSHLANEQGNISMSALWSEVQVNSAHRHLCYCA